MNNELSKELQILQKQALEKLVSIKALEEIEKIRVAYLGKQGKLTQIFRKIGELSAEKRPTFGQEVNLVKNKITKAISEHIKKLTEIKQENLLKKEYIDITLPGDPIPIGSKHPLTQTLEDIKTIFYRLGYSIEEGPEIETDYYNFEALNFPPDHPARDMHDTFFVEGGGLLRTHTSPVQIRVMEQKEPPLRILAPGRVYRNDETDASHSPVFHQVEGLLVDQGITFADLKGTLEFFVHSFFGPDKEIRFRPSFFPFTEPSAEIDVQCIICGGGGCRVCKQTGWLEILGAGLVDPNVFKFVNYDTDKYTGFAFGMGVERIAMIRYGIDDIRLFYENDLRFLRQF